jgi:sialic acid synthase SpsE/sugar phosphate isomerase/epimerase
MIIDNEFAPYILLEESSILEALNKISNNKSRILFTVTNSGVIQGVVSDGDVRRWLTVQDKVNLNTPVLNLHNPSYHSARVDDSPLIIEKIFSDRIDVVPLTDRNDRIVAVAKKQSDVFEIGDYKIGKDHPVFIIAEIGNNHNGDYDLAKKLVDEAAHSGADCAKFQMRDLDSLYRRSSNKSSSVNEDLGSEYVIDLLRKYQLSNDDMLRIFDYCHEKGVMPLCTPWDVPSIEILNNYGMSGFKVASADLVNHHLLEKLIATHKPLICSTGMSREEEIVESVKFLRNSGAQFSLLHCNSTYPAPFKDVNLKYLRRLSEIGQCVVGYSGHERGINVPIASLGFGAKIIEKHFSLDRNMEGNDHKVSLLPQEFSTMVKGLREVEESIGSGKVREITQGELMNREVLGKSLVINCDLKKGKVIRESMIDIRSPGQGLPPYQKKELVGKKATHDFSSDDFFFLSDLENNLQYKSREFNFKRKWGVPVRFHDLDNLSCKTNPDLVEFHLSYKDLNVDIDSYLNKKYDMDLVIHAPELFPGDHILDLCSRDKEYRDRSISELQRVVDITRKIRKSFNKATERTLIIVNVGGATQDAPLDSSKRAEMYEMIADSLSKIDQLDVEIIPQTMPPFPWHFGGQRYHNLFMDGQDIAAFCKKYNYRVCLDVSHSKLACNYHKWSFKEFINTVGPYSAHLHIVDAYGVDGEGVQIGQGEIDFPAMTDWLNEFSPDSSFIPEIWQGHKDNGSGFWYALDKLEQWL